MTYTLQPSDAGTYVCAVEMDQATGLVVGVSDAVGPVGPGPSISGVVTQGQTLSLTEGAWGGVTPTDTWWRCDALGGHCVTVASGAPDTSYPLTRSDVGFSIMVVETATGASTPEATALTGTVSATPPTITSPPTLSGTAEVGSTLTASPGSWTNQPTSYADQWERCASGSCSPIGSPIVSATGVTTYTPVAADIGDTLEVLVTASVAGVDGFPYPSYPSGVVTGVSTSTPPSPGPGPSPPPVIPVTNPHTSAVGRLSATMLWTFRYAPTYTQIAALAVQGPAMGSTISTACTGKGCPFGTRRVRVRALKRCRGKPHCRAPHKVNLARKFRGRHLRIGSTLTVAITRPHDIGKYYRFVVRRRRAPSVKISCLAPGSGIPGKHCSGA